MYIQKDWIFPIFFIKEPIQTFLFSCFVLHKEINMYILSIYIFGGAMTVISIQKWGNSQGIRIPKSILNELHWDANEELCVTVEDQKLIIETMRKRKNIIELFADFDGEYVPVEIDWGELAGKELW